MFPFSSLLASQKVQQQRENIHLYKESDLTFIILYMIPSLSIRVLQAKVLDLIPFHST